MELNNPIYIYIAIIFIILVLIIIRRKKNSYKKGSKIANTKYVKSSSYYKNLLFRYKFLSFIILLFISVGLIVCSILCARVQEVYEENKTLYNRDIMLCLDVSGSMNEQNKTLVDELRTVVDGLHGDRFGITIFNASAITLVPLTSDFKYVDRILDTVSRSFKAQIDGDYKTDQYIYNYVTQGTYSGDRGTSLIPDGLLTCGLTFNEKDKERTRLVILSTDNYLAGTAVFTLAEAAKYLKDNNILLYGIGAEGMYSSKEKQEYKEAVAITKGKFYDPKSNTMEKIVKDIDTLSKTAIDSSDRIYKHDRPKVLFIVLLVFVALLFVVSKLVNL